MTDMTDMTQEPSRPPSPPTPPPHRDVLTPGMLEALKKTKPWVRFLSILGFIAVGLIIVAALFFFGAGAIAGSQAGPTRWVFMLLPILYLLMAVLYIFPSLYLFRYASAIENALTAPSKSPAVENALRQQKSFWKFTGILALVMVLLYIPGILAAIAIPNFLTAMERAKQKRTMVDVRTIANLIETHAAEKDGRFPEAASMDELARTLAPATVPRLDGWGAPFVYAVAECENGRCARYFIASGGKNMKLEKSPAEYGPGDEQRTSSFDGDIVFSNGSFLSAPEGI